MGEKEREQQRDRERSPKKRERLLMHNSQVKCIWACWETKATGRHEELGGTAESEGGRASAVAKKTIQCDRDGTSTGPHAAVLLWRRARRCVTWDNL